MLDWYALIDERWVLVKSNDPLSKKTVTFFFSIWIFSPSKPPQNKPPQTRKDEGFSTFQINSSSWNHSTNAPRFACKNVMFMNNVASGRCARLGKGFGKGRLMKGEVNQEVYCDICTTYTEYIYILSTRIYIFYKRWYNHMIYEHYLYSHIRFIHEAHIFAVFQHMNCNYTSPWNARIKVNATGPLLSRLWSKHPNQKCLKIIFVATFKPKTFSANSSCHVFFGGLEGGLLWGNRVFFILGEFLAEVPMRWWIQTWNFR